MAFLPNSLPSHWAVLGIVLLSGILYPFYLYFVHPLRRYPGPFLAKFTDLWRFYNARGKRSHLSMIELHERYGPVVRTGPNTISISDASYVNKIYGHGRGFVKSAFYNPFQGWVGNKIGYNLFTTQDVQHHQAIKQPIASSYGFNAALEFEPIVSECISNFVKRLEEEFVSSDKRPGKPCDLAAWLQYYAFDVIAIMTWGKSFGFLDRGVDVNNMISRLDERLDIIAPTSQMPWLDWLRTKNSIVNLFRDKANGFATFAATLIQERQNDLRDRKTAAVEGPRLFIDRFLDAQRAHPATVDDRQVVIYTTSNVMAGSDSVAITLRTIMYMILRHEKVLKKLLQEIDGAELSFPVTWEQCQRLTYLDAVIQESLRIHPPVGFGLERVVPADGLVMDDGTRIPKGTQVSMNAWVVHLDPVFGPEPKTFKPERWLKADRESEEGYQSRLAAMKRASVAFGAGSRACMGRHLSFVEMAKLIPSLLMKFRFELALGKDEEWKTVNSWFVRQSDMDVYIENR